jgi:4-amino-4-deoxy-L-arabinose transferase-like glycosyltransferase
VQTKLANQPRVKGFALVILLFAAAVALFAKLGSGALFWDEAIYAQVSKEILETGDWFTPHWNGRVLFHKPPLFFWFTATLYESLGLNEFSARATSAFFGLAVLVTSYLIARRLFNDLAALLSVMVLLSTQLFISYARFGTTDMTLTFFILLAVYGYLKSEDEDRFWLLTGTACGLAIMTKGAAGLIAPFALLLTALIQRRMASVVRNGWMWAGFIIAALIVLPWHVTMYWLYGDSFIKGYALQQVLERTTTDLHQYGRGPGYYLSVLMEFFWPWIYFLPFAIVFSRKKSLVVVVLSGSVLVLYTVVQTKFQWYVLPAVPAFAILIAGFVTRYADGKSHGQRTVIMVVFLLLVLTGSYGVVRRLSVQRPELEAAARLAKISASNPGAIAAYPENLEMTVKYYSGRKLCADPVLSPLSYNERTACAPGETKNIIFKKANLPIVARTYRTQPLFEDADLIYAVILEN